MATPRDDDNGMQVDVDMATPGDNEIRIVLLGKTGAGKSFLGNNLLGEKIFKSKAGASSTTTGCQRGYRVLEHGEKRVIVDTPGLHDNTKSSDEIRQCISMSAPGVHAFIIVLRIGRFTKEELETIKKLQSLFGENVTQYAFVVFTYKGNLDDDQTLDGYIEESPENLKRMLRQCGSRCVAVDNLAKGKDLQADIEGVMNLIYKTMAANCGRFYTAEDMFAAAENRVQRGLEGTCNKATSYSPHLGQMGRTGDLENYKYMGKPSCPVKLRKTELDVPSRRSHETKDVSAKEITIVLLGRIGAGKSSLGNNLLTEKKFKTKASTSSVTSECQMGSRVLENGSKLIIVDTPGLYDPGRSDGGRSAAECCRSVALFAPKVHVFILVLHIGGFTAEECETVKELYTLFGEKVSKHAFIVFTDKACLDGDEVTLQQFIEEAPESLQLMLNECRSRYVAVDNHSTGENLKTDMDDVMQLINQIVTTNEGEMFTVAEKVPKMKKGTGQVPKMKKETGQLTTYQKSFGGPMSQTNRGSASASYTEVHTVTQWNDKKGRHTVESVTQTRGAKDPNSLEEDIKNCSIQ